MKYRNALTTLTLAAILGTVPHTADAEYRVSVGDVLELSVVGVPELHSKSSVTPEGRASFPLIGDLAAEGRSLVEIRDELRAKLSQKIVPRVDGKGVEDTVSFSPEQINLVVGEYRPIYVAGHVAQPGEQRYRVGMTAREAVAVAGGISLLPFGSGSGQGSAALAQGLASQAEYSVLLNDLAHQQVRLQRLQAEYAGKPTGPAIPVFAGADTSRQSELERLEAERLAGREAAVAKEKTHLQQAAEKVERHLALLADRRGKEAASLEADQADFNRINELFRGGIAVAGRVSEARRTVLLSATQLLQTDASIATAERDLLTLRREVGRLDERRREGLVTEIQEATLKIQNLQAKLMYAAQQVALLPSPTLPLDGTDAANVIIFRRKAAGARERMAANHDTELVPGDVVEISFTSAPAGVGLTATR
jgi:polysaccharide export outer membrane protein